MRLTRLSLTNFRSFTRLDVDLPRRILLLIGDNAQGKTSLLEAIFFLATFSSFHTQTDRHLVSFTAGEEELQVARIVAEVEKQSKSIRMEVRLIIGGRCHRQSAAAQRDSRKWSKAKSGGSARRGQCSDLSAPNDAHFGGQP